MENPHFILAISYSGNKHGNIRQGLLISFAGKSNEGSLHSFRTLTDKDRQSYRIAKIVSMGFNHFTVAFTAKKRICIVSKQNKNYIAKKQPCCLWEIPYKATRLSLVSILRNQVLI